MTPNWRVDLKPSPFSILFVIWHATAKESPMQMKNKAAHSSSTCSSSNLYVMTGSMKEY